MSALKCTLPLLMLVTFFSGQSDAQSSLSLYKTTYRIQVKYEMWRNGSTYWATEYETSNLSDARMMLALFETALANGSLSDIMNCGPEWIAIDVRLTTKKEWYWAYDPIRFNTSTVTR